ncbi:hypothetical protein [Streptomyces sp. 900105245]
MNGWGFAAVAVVCGTALAVALLWAVVRVGQRQADGAGMELVDLPDEVVQARNSGPGCCGSGERRGEGGE